MKSGIVALAFLTLDLPGCAGSLPAAVSESPSPVPTLTSPSPTASVAASESPSPVASPVSPSPTGLVTLLVNKTGHFSFQHPATWAFLNCDPATPGVGLAIRADASHPVYCANEACYFAILVTSVPGDQTSGGPSKVGCMQYVSGQTTTAVTVNGVAGTRIADTFAAGSDKTGGFGPDQGTDQVLYAVYDGTRTYLALYQHQPNQPDETARFDDLMQRTFQFLQ